MINKENLNKLYNGLIENRELTTEELNEYGFNSKDLSDLIENGTLVVIKRGYYSFQAINDLFYYGKKLLKEKNYDKASLCFEKCFELNPNHIGTCLQLFLRSIYKKDYKKSLEYFEHFFRSNNKFYKADNNFYLYLLNMVTELPEEYSEYAKSLKFEDFRVDLEDMRYENIPLQNEVRLLASERRFVAAYVQLNELVKLKGVLSIQDIIIRALLNQAVDVQTKNRNEVLDLLRKKDYKVAIEFLENLKLNHKLCLSENYVLLLCRDLLDIKDSKIVPKKEVLSANNLFKAIRGKNYELALEFSTAYNKKINANLEDNSIQILLQAINEEIKKLPHDNIEEYENKENVVEISKTDDIEQERLLTDELEQILNSTEKNQKQQLLEWKKVLESVDSSRATINDSYPKIDDKKVSKPIIKKANKDYNDYDFIIQKLDDLHEKGIVLLKPMNDERRKGIREIVGKIPDVASFSIGTGDSRRIVLRYNPYFEGGIDRKQLLNNGNEAYKIGDYDLCIYSFRKLLEFGTPKSFVYAKLGLAYMKKFDKDTAIDYLTVATEVSKLEDNEYDFTELIAYLGGTISEKDKKARPIMTTSDFDNDVDEYYGITNIEEIVGLISTGLSVAEACQSVGLDDEQVGIVNLIFARECYSQENYLLGDQYMKQVERMKDKTKFVTSLFDEIRKNKKFYKNRVDENHKRLVLTSPYKKN